MPKQETCDVVVVGGGGSGLFAAIEAARLGRQVILLEKNPCLGGTTSWSIGSISSSCSPLQAKEGIQDTPGAHFEDMALFQGELLPRDNPELRHVLVENVPDTLRQLIDMGVVFFGPMPEPPHRVARMHNVLPNSKSYAYHLGKRARRLNVDIRLGIRARQLVQDDDGTVRGVEAEAADGKTTRFLAQNGVVLACGDFSANREMKAENAAEDIADIDATVPTSNGDGHRLAVALGAKIVNGDLLGGPQVRFVPPGRNIFAHIPPYRPVAKAIKFAMQTMPAWLLRPFIMMFVTTFLEPQRGLFQEGAVLVNLDGNRFTDECGSPQFEIHKQPGKKAFIILDDRLAKQFSYWPHYISTAPGVAYAYLPDYRRNRRDVYRVGRTPAHLAAKIGVPADALAATLEAHNATLKDDAKQLIKPPFHALGPVKSWIVVTEGGLQVTNRLEVLHKAGGVIPGLFAAGANGQGGLILEGHGHHLGWAFTSGRLAGRYAAFFNRSVQATTEQPAASTDWVA